MTIQKMSDDAKNYFDLTPNMSKLDRHIFLPVNQCKPPIILIQPENIDIFELNQCDKINLNYIDTIIYNDLKKFLIKNYFIFLEYFDKKISFNDLILKI
jgi:hypothetical protein